MIAEVPGIKVLIIGAGVIGSFYEIQELAGELRVIMRQARLPCPGLCWLAWPAGA